MPATKGLNWKQGPCLIPETVFHHDFYDRESAEPGQLSDDGEFDRTEADCVGIDPRPGGAFESGAIQFF